MAGLNNNYLIMRHGFSEGNKAKLIVSDPAIGCVSFGLTELGRAQVEASALKFKQVGISQIIHSDFVRAVHTAQIVATCVGCSAIRPDIALRERFFGDYDGLSDQHYSDVWDNDVNNTAANDRSRVESVMKVRARGLELIESLEQSFLGETILLVSHGDLLQILRTAFEGIPANQHRSLAHHETAEIKWLAKVGTVISA